MMSLSEAQQYHTGDTNQINHQWSQIHHGSFIFHVNGCSDQKVSLEVIASPTILCSHAAFVGYQISANSPQHTQLTFTRNDMSNGSTKDRKAKGLEQCSWGVVQPLQTPLYQSIVDLTVVSSLLPSQVCYNGWQSHFHVTTQTHPEVLPAHFNE